MDRYPLVAVDGTRAASNEGVHAFVVDDDLEESDAFVKGFKLFDGDSHATYNFSFFVLICWNMISDHTVVESDKDWIFYQGISGPKDVTKHHKKS